MIASSEANAPGSERGRPSLGRAGAVAAILGVLFVAAAFRFVRLDSVPPAINQDEAERAYDAFCLRHTGTDFHGQRWPIFFRAFGVFDYPPGPYIYALVPVQSALGMSVWTTRLPAASLGTLNVWLLYLLVKRFYGRQAGALAALLLAVSPWHVHLSRLAFEVSLCIPLITLVMLLLALGAGRRSATEHPSRCHGGAAVLFLAGVIAGVTFWAYNAMRVFVPLLLLGTAWVYREQVRALLRDSSGRRRAVAWACGFSVGIAPFVWACIATPSFVWGRARAVSVFGQSDTLAAAFRSLASGYLTHLSPGYLFLRGDASLVQSVPGSGQLDACCALLLPLGLYRVIRRRRTERFGLVVLAWILAGPVPAAMAQLEVGSGHALRSAGSVPAYAILAALGLDMILAAAGRYSRRAYRTAVAVSAGLVAACTVRFAYLFFVAYPPAASAAFLAEWPPVLEEIKRRLGEYDAVVLPFAGQTGMLYLFTAAVDPQEWFGLPHHIEEKDGNDFILRAGKVFFHPGHFLEAGVKDLPPNARVLIGGFPVPPGGAEIRRFYDAGGNPFLSLYEIRLRRG